MNNDAQKPNTNVNIPPVINPLEPWIVVTGNTKTTPPQINVSSNANPWDVPIMLLQVVMTTLQEMAKQAQNIQIHGNIPRTPPPGNISG